MKFYVGKNHIIEVESDLIKMVDFEKMKSAILSLQRWARLKEYIDEIDEAVSALTEGKFLKYRLHLGAAWIVSVYRATLC